MNRVAHLVLSYKVVPWPYFFSGGQKILFVFCVSGFHRSQLQHIAAQASHLLGEVQHVRLLCEHAGFIAMAGIVCDHWRLHIGRRRASLWVLLTHV